MFDLAVGEAAFLKLAATDHQRCLADPVLSHPFSHEGHPEMSSDLPATGPKSSGDLPLVRDRWWALCDDQHSRFDGGRR
jgi:hypothetical protein